MEFPPPKYKVPFPISTSYIKDNFSNKVSRSICRHPQPVNVLREVVECGDLLILCYVLRDLVLHVTWSCVTCYVRKLRNWWLVDKSAHSNLQLSSSTSYNQYILQYYSLIYMRILTEAALTISQFNLQLILVAPKSLWLVPILVRFTHKIHLGKIPSVTDASAPRFHQCRPNYKYQQLLSFMAV